MSNNKRKPMSQETKDKLRQKAMERKNSAKEIKTEENIDISNTTPTDKPIKGLGDVVEKITKFFGIEPCDKCIKRKEKMNTFEFLRLIDTPTYDEVEMLRRTVLSKTLLEEDKKPFFEMYNRLFKRNVKVCNCPGVILGMVETLQEFIDINTDPSEN
jgi:hypothetical protein